jgi:hypothetical protein
MLENHIYNLMMQMVQESQSLWRIQEMYGQDSDCDHCRAFWQGLEEQKKETIRELQRLISEHTKPEMEIAV